MADLPRKDGRASHIVAKTADWHERKVRMTFPRSGDEGRRGGEAASELASDAACGSRPWMDDLPLQTWRPGSESNRRTRLCRPLHDHSATRPILKTTALRAVHGALPFGILPHPRPHGDALQRISMRPATTRPAGRWTRLRTRPHDGTRAQKTKTPARGVFERTGAGNETRTRDPDLGKVVLYQLSYSREDSAFYLGRRRCQRARRRMLIPRARFRTAYAAMPRAGTKDRTTASGPPRQPAAPVRAGTRAGRTRVLAPAASRWPPSARWS